MFNKTPVDSSLKRWPSIFFWMITNFNSVAAQTQNEATAVGSKSLNDTVKATNVVAKKRNISPFNTVIKKANKLFLKQVLKDTKIKQECIVYCITPNLYADAPRFWEEYRIAVEAILDSKKFEKNCNDAKLNPQYVAEHLVMEGRAMIRTVLAEGFAPLKGRERYFTSPILKNDFFASDVVSANIAEKKNPATGNQVA